MGPEWLTGIILSKPLCGVVAVVHFVAWLLAMPTAMTLSDEEKEDIRILQIIRNQDRQSLHCTASLALVSVYANRTRIVRALRMWALSVVASC